MALSSSESSGALSWELVEFLGNILILSGLASPVLIGESGVAQYQLLILCSWAQVFLTVLPTTLWIFTFSSLTCGKRHCFPCVSFRHCSLVFSEGFSPQPWVPSLHLLLSEYQTDYLREPSGDLWGSFSCNSPLLLCPASLIALSGFSTLSLDPGNLDGADLWTTPPPPCHSLGTGKAVSPWRAHLVCFFSLTDPCSLLLRGPGLNNPCFVHLYFFF